MDNAGETQTITTNDKRVNMAMVPIGSEEIDVVESTCTLPHEAAQTAEPTDR